MSATDDFTRRLHRSADFALANGAVLPELVQSHLALGTLNAAGDNAVIVLHGLTTGPAMLAPGAFAAEGAWCDLVGPAARSTPTDSSWCVPTRSARAMAHGPGQPRPAQRPPYGTTFPDMTVGDMIARRSGCSITTASRGWSRRWGRRWAATRRSNGA